MFQSILRVIGKSMRTEESIWTIMQVGIILELQKIGEKSQLPCLGMSVQV